MITKGLAMRLPGNWWRLSLAGLVALLLGARASAADPPVVVESMRVGLGSEFKVGTWTPVWVQLKGGSQPFQGFLDLTVPDDDGSPSIVRRPVLVGARATEWFATYARPGALDAQFTAQVRDQNLRSVGRELPHVVLSNDVHTLWSNQVVLATMGNPQGVQGIPKIPGFSTGDGPQQVDAVAVVPVRVPDGIPGRWYGYDALEAVVIDTNDQAVMDALEAGRGEGLKEWVRQGGHLIVSVGQRWQQVRDSVLGPMLPALPNGRTQLDDLGTLESFAGSTRPITKAGSAPVLVTKLEGLEARGGKALDSSVTPLVVRGSYGFGRVTVVALDVDQKPFSVWDDRSLFWIKAIDLQRQAEQSSSGAAGPPGGGSLFQQNVSDMATLLRKALDQFPGIRLVPFGWVAFFIFLYILLIGPGDYLFLKKVLKRMELTWITFPVIVLTVSLLAYFTAYALKGMDLRVNKVDAIDIDQQSGRARGSTFFTVFSPQNRDYAPSLDVQRLEQAAPEESPASGRSEMLLTWFGMPETGFGGQNGSGRMGLSGSPYLYGPRAGGQAPPDRLESLAGVRVPIWSTKSFLARWSGPAAPVVDASIEIVGTDRVAGTVANRLKSPLKDAVLAFGKQVYLLGTIAPGGSVQLELQNNRTLSGYLADQARGLNVEPWNLDRTLLPRAQLMRTILFREAGGQRASKLSSTALSYLDLTGQLALDRPMLLAEIDEPGTELDLGPSIKASRVDQTTLLRVVLELGKPKSPGAGP